MDTKGNLALYITANASSFMQTINAAQKKFNDFGDKMQSVGSKLTLGLTAPLVGFAAKAASEFRETQKALGQVEAALRSTGGAVGYTTAQLDTMAKQLQNTSIFSDDEILSGVTSQLLTFTNVTGKAFEGAQQAAIDLSSRLGQDLQSSAIQLGKALNDPVKGLTALGRVGVQFTDQQKAMIQSMVAAGDIAGAQGVILKELNTEFGGSAQAAVDAGGGVIQLRNAFNDMAETVGGLLAPYIQQLTGWLKGLIEKFQNLSPETQKIIVGIGAAAAAIGPLLMGVGSLVKGFGPLTTALRALPALFTALTGPIGLIVAGIAAAAALIITHWDEVRTYFTTGPGAKVFDKAKEVVSKLYDLIVEVFTAISDVVGVLWESFGDDFMAVLDGALGEALKVISYTLDQVIDIIKLFRALSSGEWESAWDIVKNIWKRALNLLIENLRGAVTNFLGLWDKVFSFFGADDFVDPAIQAVNDFANYLRFDIPEAAKAAEESASTLTNSISNGLKKSTQDARALGDAITEATSRRTSSQDLAPIQSTGTDNLSIPGTQALPDQLYTGWEVPESTLTMQEQFNMKLQESIDLNEKAKKKYTELGELIGATFQQGATDMKDYLKNVTRALANLVRDSIKMFLAQAIAGYASKALATLGPVGVAIAAAAPAAVSGIFDAIVPKFAEGGMVTGPTLAMVGDNPSGKEAIIPFEKMGNFLGQFQQGGQTVVVLEHRISGNDLIILGRNAQNSNIKTFGRTI